MTRNATTAQSLKDLVQVYRNGGLTGRSSPSDSLRNPILSHADSLSDHGLPRSDSLEDKLSYSDAEKEREQFTFSRESGSVLTIDPRLAADVRSSRPNARPGFRTPLQIELDYQHVKVLRERCEAYQKYRGGGKKEGKGVLKWWDEKEEVFWRCKLCRLYPYSLES